MSAGGHFGKWPPGGSSAVAPPQICSIYIDLPLCQNWCFYQKMHNRLAYPPHYEEGGGVEVTGLGKQQVCQVQPRFLEVHI